MRVTTFFNASVFISTAYVFFLPTKYISRVYHCITPLVSIILSLTISTKAHYFLVLRHPSSLPLNNLPHSSSTLMIFLVSALCLILQVAFAKSFLHTIASTRKKSFEEVLSFASFTFPTLCTLVCFFMSRHAVHLSSYTLKPLPFLTLLWPVLMLYRSTKSSIPHILAIILQVNSQSRSIVQNIGMRGFLQNEISRLKIKVVLTAFWVSRIIFFSVSYLVRRKNILPSFFFPVVSFWRQNFPNTSTSYPIPYEISDSLFLRSQEEVAENSANHNEFPQGGEQEILVQVVRSFFPSLKLSFLSKSCDTFLSVFGLSCVISYLCRVSSCVLQKLLSTTSTESRSNDFSFLSFLLFLILAFQNGLTGFKKEERMNKLLENLYLLGAILLQFVHDTVNPILLSLSATANPSFQRHARALAVSFFLLIFPYWFMSRLWIDHESSAWLLSISAFSMLTSIKMFITLCLYFLTLLETTCQHSPSPTSPTMAPPSTQVCIDRLSYVIQSLGSVVEFIFAIFLFVNGSWTLLFQSGGTIRALNMFIHAYFNIWLQAQKGWKIFVQRRMVSQKMNLLESATPDQLKELQDICSICQQALHSARITKCGHFFHEFCLKKWLHIQDTCPLCHQIVYNQKIFAETQRKQARRRRR